MGQVLSMDIGASEGCPFGIGHFEVSGIAPFSKYWFIYIEVCSHDCEMERRMRQGQKEVMVVE